jgi:hypothetical protein
MTSKSSTRGRAFRFGKFLFATLFVLALSARVVRIFLPMLQDSGGKKHPVQRAQAATSTSSVEYVQGEIVRVDPEAHELVVHPLIAGNAPDVSFHIEPGQTHIRFGPNELSVDEVHLGDHATVSYDKKAGARGSRVASEVKVARSGGPR